MGRWKQTQCRVVTNVKVGLGLLGGIDYVKFDYIDQNGQSKEGSLHGIKRTDTILDSSGTYHPSFFIFVINHPEEYLIAVEGWYGSSQHIIQGLVFKTNKKSYRFVGRESNDGTTFSLQVKDKKIIGFHGFFHNNLSFLGAYFVPESLQVWDDGLHKKVNKVELTYDEVIYSIQVTYDGTNLQSQRRGSIGLKNDEFTLDTDEYITALSSYTKTMNSKAVITALTFTTNKNTYGPYGNKSNNQVSAPALTGKQISGFHGTSSNVLNSINVHYSPIQPLALSKKLEAKGGDAGDVWHDGAHNGVKKVYVGQCEDGISFLKFEYHKGGSQEFMGDEHGNRTMLELDTFELDYPSEYITSVEGTYQKLIGFESELVTWLKFKTNKNIYGPFGLQGSRPFNLMEEGYKIIGFHGKADQVIYQIGVHILPINT